MRPPHEDPLASSEPHHLLAEIKAVGRYPTGRLDRDFIRWFGVAPKMAASGPYPGSASRSDGADNQQAHSGRDGAGNQSALTARSGDMIGGIAWSTFPLRRQSLQS